MLDRTNYKRTPSDYIPTWAAVVILCCTYLAIGAVVFLMFDVGNRAVTSIVLAIAMMVGIACALTHRRN
jgi:hypothetical protein